MSSSIDAVARRPWRLGIVGPGGAMGRRVLAMVDERLAAGVDDFVLAATLQRPPSAASAPRPPPARPISPASPRAGGDVLHTTDPTAFAAAIDVAVDFSAPAAAPVLARILAAAKVAYVVASTGLEAAAKEALLAAASEVPVLVAANTNFGVHVLAAVVQRASALLGAADVEVVEVHHRRKRDAPSGTALMLGAAVAAGRAEAGARTALQPKFGRGPQDPPRQTGELGYSAVRGGDVVGEHTVLLLLDGERVELSHRCTDANTFARGALAAAAWLVDRPPGSYTMAQVLAAAAS